MRVSTLFAAIAMTTIAVTGCSSNDQDSGSTAPATPDPATPSVSASSDPTPSSSPSPTKPEETGPSLKVVIDGDKISPNGKSIDLATGEALTIRFDTDRSGELHVHAKPEQYVEFKQGTSTKKLTIKTPGVVEVEEHETGHVVAKIKVD